MSQINEELNYIQQQRRQITAMEESLRTQRKQQVGWLAEQCGILSLPDDELISAFEKIACNYR